MKLSPRPNNGKIFARSNFIALLLERDSCVARAPPCKFRFIAAEQNAVNARRVLRKHNSRSRPRRSRIAQTERAD
jgi:hypothetical protein